MTGDEAKKAAAAAAQVKAGQSEAAKRITEKDNEMFSKFTTPASPADIRVLTGGPEVNGDITMEGGDQNGGEKCSEQTSRTPIHEDSTSINLDVQSESSGPEKAVSTPVSSPRTSPRLPACPNSSFQFQADWKQLRNTSEQFYQYFKVFIALQKVSVLLEKTKMGAYMQQFACRLVINSFWKYKYREWKQPFGKRYFFYI